MDNRPIGIFDSGVGGLTVVKEIVKVLPQEDIVYFGDTARLPYGSKSKETVTRFSAQDVRFLLSKNVKAIVIACNTASSNSLESLRQMFDVPLFGVVLPGVQEAIAATKNGKIGIIGTAATIRSGAYARLIQEQRPDMQVFSKACPLFVPLAEEGFVQNTIAQLTAKEYLGELTEKGIDALVLGCTHYPLLKRCIGETVGESVRLVDPARATAMQLKDFLQQKDALHAPTQEGKRSFYCSDDAANFSALCERALKQSYTPRIIDIESY